MIDRIKQNLLRLLGVFWIIHSSIIFSIIISIKNSNELMFYVTVGYSLSFFCLINGLLFMKANSIKMMYQEYRILDKSILNLLKNSKKKQIDLNNLSSKGEYKQLLTYFKKRNKIGYGNLDLNNHILEYKVNR